MNNDVPGTGAATTVVDPRRNLPRIPGYEVTRLLGEGGMASVFLATDVRLERQVAIKTMSTRLSADPQFRSRFTDEARTVAALRHPNVVTVFASGEADEQLYIVMEYVPGGTLADRLMQGPMPLAEALAVARGLLRALVHLHAEDVVHRDIKPSNVLFTPSGDPVLSDFGIAKALDADSARTTVGAVIGSPKYMAPEQLLGNPVTDRADIYSFALVLLEMLSGEVPPREVTSMRGPKDVEALRRRLPASAVRCSPLLSQCLRLEPSERPSSSTVLNLVETLAADARPRGRWLLPAGVAAVVLTGGVLWIAGLTSTQVAEPEPAAIEAVAPDVVPAAVPVTVRDRSAEMTLAQALPSATEFSEFTAAFDADAPRSRPVPELTYPPYRKLMAMLVVWRGGGSAALANDVAEVRANAMAGDPRARLMLFLAAYAGLIDDTPSNLLQGVKAASDDGYALATYYYALFYREQQENADGELDPTSLEKLRDLYSLAVRQGLTFAKRELQEANQLLDTNPSP